MTRRPPGAPDWPSHHADAAPPPDPRSRWRGALAATAVLLLAAALAIAAPLPVQERLLTLLLGWIVAVVVGRWAYRGRSGREAVATRAMLLLGSLAMAGVVVLLVISLAVRDVLAGTVIFGNAGSDCVVEGEADVFDLGDAVYAVAHARRLVEAGESITLRLIHEGAVVSETTAATPRSFDCLGRALELERVGRYTLELSSGTDVLAVGSVTLRPGAGSTPILGIHHAYI